MHILWVNEFAFPTGGAERYIADTAQLMSKYFQATSTLLYSVASDTEPGFLGCFDKAFPIVNLERQISQLNPDVIYVHRLDENVSLKRIMACNKPVVRFFHDHKLFCLREHKYTTIGHHTCTKPIGLHCYPCLGFVNKSNRFFKVKLQSLRKFREELRMNQQLDAIVVGSKYMAQHVAQHGFSSSMIHVNPLYTLQYQDEKTTAKNSDKNRDNLLFVGQIVRGKGIDILLEALPKLHQKIPLVICGSGHQEAELKAQAQKLGVSDQLRWVGKVAQEELAGFYRSALCVVVPSRVPETFGLIGLEAMRFGTPVVGTAVGGIPQWLKDGHNGYLVPSNDSAKLAEAINRFIGDRELAQLLGQQGKRDLEQKFQPRFHIENLHHLFLSLMSK